MVSVGGGDGTSFEKAIVISDCNDLEGIDQEYLELHYMFGKFELLSQSVIHRNRKVFDKLEILAENKHYCVYFDITAFFDKGLEW